MFKLSLMVTLLLVVLGSCLHQDPIQLDSYQQFVETQSASERFVNAFNSGDAKGCAAQYEEDAVIIATPLGKYIGREKITAFWQKLINDGYKDVKYINPKYTKVDGQSFRIQSDWTMNIAKGKITSELWVLQNNGTMKLRRDEFQVDTR